jgi:hypothetical protein
MESTRTEPKDEREQVRRWRILQLERAGYNRYDAFVLSGDLQVDLHRAQELLERGCPAPVALQILL